MKAGDKLEEYEEICSNCGGSGWVEKNYGCVSVYTQWHICLNCAGTGKIDWIDKIKNKMVQLIQDYEHEN